MCKIVGVILLGLMVGCMQRAKSAHGSSNPSADEAKVWPEPFTFSKGFSSNQGGNQWFYKEWDSAGYRDMHWDPTSKQWKGSSKYSLIGQGWAHPDATEAVIAWQAPKDGTVTIQGTMERLHMAGDGTLAKIMLNGQQVWPSEGHQEVYPGFAAQHILTADVNGGDFIYFHLNKHKSPEYDTTNWDPTITYNAPPKFTTDKATYVMRPGDFDRMKIMTMDVSLSILSQGSDQDFVWLHSENFGTEHQKFVGPLHAPGKSLTFKKEANHFFVSNPTRADGEYWLTNIHEHDDGSLLGFVHVERSGASRKKFRMGLAYSTNRGDSWTYLGHMITQEGDPDDVNITGTPYVKTGDGYIYIYFNDNKPAVARAPLAEVIAAAKQGKLTPWMKYHNGSWGEPGLGGKSSQLNCENGILHGDSAYSVTKKKFILTGYNHGTGRGVWIGFSDDGLNWSKGDWIQLGTSNNYSLSPYITIINEDGRDNGQVGDSFYAYWAFNPEWDKTYNMGLRYLVRQKIVLQQP